MEEKISPADIYVAILDTFNEPMFVMNDENIIMNEAAQKLNETGLNLIEQSKKIKSGSSALISHKNNKYRISKKDFGLNYSIFKLSIEDEVISKLHKSSLKLKKVLSSI